MIYIIIALSLLTILFGYMTIKALLNPKDLKEFDLYRYNVTDEFGKKHTFVIEDQRDYRRMKEIIKDWSPLCRVEVWQGDTWLDVMFLEDLF